jgi:predicted RNase H-like HicB family nuclease
MADDVDPRSDDVWMYNNVPFTIEFSTVGQHWVAESIDKAISTCGDTPAEAKENFQSWVDKLINMEVINEDGELNPIQITLFDPFPDIDLEKHPFSIN